MNYSAHVRRGRVPGLFGDSPESSRQKVVRRSTGLETTISIASDLIGLEAFIMVRIIAILQYVRYVC